MKTKNRRGFTIVELVIVIAVIGILSAILIPTFSNLVGNANAAALQQELRQAYVDYELATAESGVTLGMEEVFISKDASTESVYKYSSADKKWIVEETEQNYSQVEDTEAYNGYKVYIVSNN